MVYMSSSGLDWHPRLASWFKRKKVKAEDAAAIKKLFETYFHQIYKWCYTALTYVMEVLQVSRGEFLRHGRKKGTMGIKGIFN